MSAVQDVLAGLDRCLSKISETRAALAHAQECVDEAGQPAGLGLLLESRDDEAQQAIWQMSETAEGIVHVQQAANLVTELISKARNVIAGDGSVTPDASLIAGQEPVAVEYDVHARQVRRARNELPSSPPGSRMTGVYLPPSAGGGTGEPLRSGPTKEDGTRDKDWRMACSYLADLDPMQFSVQNPPMFAQHIEPKFAMRMWRERIADADIVIEDQPCGSGASLDDDNARLTCARWLPKMLPPGSTLRVTIRNGTTYTYYRPGKAE